MKSKVLATFATAMVESLGDFRYLTRSSPLTDCVPVTPPDHSPEQEPAASRLGLSLFCIYTILYLAFVLLNAFAADAMDRVVFAGLNLAIVFGFGLILAAIAMAFVYGFALRGDGDSA